MASLSSFLVGPNGQFSEAIAQGPDQIRGTNDILDGFLDVFNEFKIPVSPTVRNFDGVRQDPDPTVFPGEIKFDFADFDFDGDGSLEACTGCTCPVGCNLASCPSEAPVADLKKVCFRIWIKRDLDQPFERVMAGFFERLPVLDDPATPTNEENHGKGRFRVGRNTPGTGPAQTSGLFLGAVYDHRDPAHPLNKFTETFAIDQGGLAFSANLHALVDQVALGASLNPQEVKKTVKVSMASQESETSPVESSQYIGRYREDLDFWSGSFVSKAGESFLENINDVCARISTGNGVANDICIDAGIDTTQEDFLPPANFTDVLFPADFPELPTF